MNKRLIFRLAMFSLLFFILYSSGVPVDSLIFLGIFFIVLIFLRGKLWKSVKRFVDKNLKFTKNWPSWAEKLLLVVIFILFYYLLRVVIFYVLGLFGINLSQIILGSMNHLKK